MSQLDDIQKNDTDDKNQLSKIDLMYHLINKGTICYLPKGFNSDNFIGNVLGWMQKTLSLEGLSKKETNVGTIEYRKKGGITGTLGLRAGFKLFFLEDKNKFYFDIKPDKWFESADNKTSVFNLGNLLNESYDEQIYSFIYTYLLQLANPINKLKIDTRNHYIDKISEQIKIWFSSQSQSEDILLSFLEISSIKNHDGKLNESKDLKWFLMISSKESKLVAFNEREEEIQGYDLNTKTIKVKNEIGRNPIEINKIKLLSTRSNAEFFYNAQHINLLDPEAKIREYARLNWLHEKENKESNQYSIDLIKHLIDIYKNPFDELSLLYMEYSGGERDKVFSAFAEDEKLINLLHHILNYAGTIDLLTKWVKNWEISYIDLIAVNSLFTKAITDTVQANNILPFHRLVREEFHKKNTDTISQTVFDIPFSRHLIKCGFGKEAKKLLNKRLEQLPDETVSDLLPAKDVDLTGKAAGQIIKVTILEILASLETEKNAIEYKCQTARLQPLVEERMDVLIQVSEEKIAAKGRELKAITNTNGLIPVKDQIEIGKYKVLDTKLIDKNLRHPASLKDGSFSNFQKWLASVKIPDYTALKSYSEKLSPQKHPELNEIITDIRYALNIENLEVYISHGEKTTGLSSFESDPSFLIIGGDHLDKNSASYLNHQELRFAVGVELAHLYFKHARITSNDVWKGAIEKGYFVLDTVLTLFPAVGLFSKSLQTIGQLNAISSFLQKTEKIGKATSKSKDLIKNSEQVVNLYKSKFLKENKEASQELEFLATSRIIQLTADRCAFIFTKDLRSAIRAMFLVSKRYNSELSIIEKYGLKDFLLKKDENGTFRHQELAIRLANLFSFYLSENYETMIKELESQK